MAKSAIALQSSTNVADGATQTGTAVDLTATNYRVPLTIRIVNNATLTTACKCTIEVSGNNATWRPWRIFEASVVAAATHDFNLELPAAILYARSVFTGHTGSNITAECLGHKIDA